MRLLRTLGLVALASTLGAAPFVPGAIDGFSPAAVPVERAYEAQFLGIPSAQGALDEATRIDAYTHYAGTRGDYDLAVWMRDTMRGFGLSAQLEPFLTRVDRPKKLVLQLIVPYAGPPPRGRARMPKPAVTTLDLREHGVPLDPRQGDPGLPFNAGSADGDVTAPLVYVHRGLDADYDRLAGYNVDVRGAVVLVRYGAQFRGLLAERAQARGALGVLFYSDPADDGATRGATYPDGLYRPGGAVQRGSVGDYVRIPTLPIAADTARTLLAALVPLPVLRQAAANPIASPAPVRPVWTGGLDVPYPYARGPALVRLGVKLERKTRTLWNTVARIPGTTQGQQTVILGAHRDAWVRGVTDNGSGITTMLEAARGLGFLARGGWRPRRSIVIAGWDGEEIGLRGSAAYVAAHRADLARGCVAYVNADEDVSGPTFGAEATGALADAIVAGARDVDDPSTPRQTLRARWGLGALVDAPGGGSDHESFLRELGTPVANLGFGGPLGTYHSTFDDLRTARAYIDPDFSLHRTMAQLDGLLAMRFADAEVLPYRFAPYTQTLDKTLATMPADASAPVRAALLTFANAAGYADAAVLRGRADPGDTSEALTARQLATARILDGYFYRIDGYSGSVLGRLAAASANGDPASVQNAVAEAVDVLARATAALASP